MFNIGFTEMLVIAVIALIFIGPKELPEIARTIGRFLNELKRSTESLKDEFKAQHLDPHLDDIKRQVSEARSEAKNNLMVPLPPMSGQEGPVYANEEDRPKPEDIGPEVASASNSEDPAPEEKVVVQKDKVKTDG